MNTFEAAKNAISKRDISFLEFVTLFPALLRAGRISATSITAKCIQHWKTTAAA
jgi:hypothetical protein